MKKVEIKIIDKAQSRNPGFFMTSAKTCVIAGIFFGPGIIAGSAAMQWAGFVIVLGLTFGVAATHGAKRMTIEEARAHLDDLESETP